MKNLDPSKLHEVLKLTICNNQDKSLHKGEIPKTIQRQNDGETKVKGEGAWGKKITENTSLSVSL